MYSELNRLIVFMKISFSRRCQTTRVLKKSHEFVNLENVIERHIKNSYLLKKMNTWPRVSATYPYVSEIPY